jgi:hypothetical protein
LIAINHKSSASDVIYGLFDKQNPEFYMDLTGFVRAGCYSCCQVSSLCFYMLRAGFYMLTWVPELLI